jgi:hypothetical protein
MCLVWLVLALLWFRSSFVKLASIFRYHLSFSRQKGKWREEKAANSAYHLLTSSRTPSERETVAKVAGRQGFEFNLKTFPAKTRVSRQDEGSNLI